MNGESEWTSSPIQTHVFTQPQPKKHGHISRSLKLWQESNSDGRHQGTCNSFSLSVLNTENRNVEHLPFLSQALEDKCIYNFWICSTFSPSWSSSALRSAPITLMRPTPSQFKHHSTSWKYIYFHPSHHVPLLRQRTGSQWYEGENKIGERSVNPSSPDRSRLVPLALDYTRLTRPKPKREPIHTAYFSAEHKDNPRWINYHIAQLQRGER